MTSITICIRERQRVSKPPADKEEEEEERAAVVIKEKVAVVKQLSDSAEELR